MRVLRRQPVSGAWPKLTGDWTVATPLIGSFGDGTHKTVVNLTRLGGVFVYDTAAPVCSPSSSPRFHHDPANSGDYARDAVAPGKPTEVKLTAGAVSLRAPGDDLLCGTADRYEVLDRGSWRPTPVRPTAAGTVQAIPVPAGARYAAVRAVDEAGNVGRPATVGR